MDSNLKNNNRGIGLSELPGGYKIRICKDGVGVGSAIINLGRVPEEKDVDAVRAIFAMGAAANSVHVGNAFRLLVEAVNNPVMIREGVDPEMEEEGNS